MNQIAGSHSAGHSSTNATSNITTNGAVIDLFLSLKFVSFLDDLADESRGLSNAGFTIWSNLQDDFGTIGCDTFQKVGIAISSQQSFKC